MTDAANEIQVSELRSHLADVLNEASSAGVRTHATRAGKRIAAIVLTDEADMFEAAEDAYLMQLADQAEANQGDKPYKPLSQVLAQYAEAFGEEFA
jgi:antitoxin (DNA-binding transcriptional repressor) of toxin-antitoxin stability system